MGSNGRKPSEWRIPMGSKSETGHTDGFAYVLIAVKYRPTQFIKGDSFIGLVPDICLLRLDSPEPINFMSRRR